MKIVDILNDKDMKLLQQTSSSLGNPDCDILDEMLLNHALALDVHDYALVRLSYTLHNIELALNRIDDNMLNS